jgi:hypothetical protein
MKVLEQHFGDPPVKALEDPEVINRFKAASDCARRVETSAPHRVLPVLRMAIHWGRQRGRR